MKLHLGCGKVILPGYVNIDEIYRPGVDEVDNIKYLRSYKGNSIEEIYACHVLEHFGRWEYKEVLKRWHELLIPGGTLKLSVPDFNAIVEYHTTFDGDMKNILGLLYGGQDHENNYHKMIWNFHTLYNVLKEEIGFQEIHAYDWSKEEHKSYHDFSQAYLPHAIDHVKLHHTPPKGGILMSVNLKAYK